MNNLNNTSTNLKIQMNITSKTNSANPAELMIVMSYELLLFKSMRKNIWMLESEMSRFV